MQCSWSSWKLHRSRWSLSAPHWGVRQTHQHRGVQPAQQWWDQTCRYAILTLIQLNLTFFLGIFDENDLRWRLWRDVTTVCCRYFQGRCDGVGGYRISRHQHAVPPFFSKPSGAGAMATVSSSNSCVVFFPLIPVSHCLKCDICPVRHYYP